MTEEFCCNGNGPAAREIQSLRVWLLFRFSGRGVGHGVVDVAGSRIGREEEQRREFIWTI